MDNTFFSQITYRKIDLDLLVICTYVNFTVQTTLYLRSGELNFFFKNHKKGEKHHVLTCFIKE